LALTNTTAKNAKPKDKPYKLSDSGGLYLYIHPSGSKTWRLKYRFDSKERVLTIGKYSPNSDFGYSLAKARTSRDQAKELLTNDIDPSQDKQRKKLESKIEQSNTFKLMTLEWWNTKKSGWSDKHADAVIHTLRQNIFPFLGHRPITEISPPELLQVIRKIESRGALEMAAKVLQRCNAIYRFAITTGRAQYNPASDLREALRTPERRNHAALSAKELPEFMRKLSTYDGHGQTRLATELLILTFVRSGELRGAKWDEIDWDKNEWRVPKERMKMKEEHIVPLSSQALLILNQLNELTGHREFIFPSQQNANKPMSENTILYALYRLGYHSRATAHGFRQTASTILNETGFTPDAIERQLAHAERNKIRAAYNKAEYLPERRKMMRWWGDYLEQIECGSNVLTANFGKK